MRFGMGGISRGIRASKKQLKITASKSAVHFLLFILIMQLVLPAQHLAYAAPGDENKPNPEDSQNPEEEILPPESYETEGTTLEAIAPDLASLIRENQSGTVAPADPNGLTTQYLELADKPGRVRRWVRWAMGNEITKPTKTIDLKVTEIARPVVSIKDFSTQVDVFIEGAPGDPTNKLVMATQNGTIRHVREKVGAITAPIIDPEFLLMATRAPRKSATAGTVNYQIELLSLDEFVGYEKGQESVEGLGYYAPTNFYPVLSFALPASAKLTGIEFYGPQSAPVVDTLTGKPMPNILRTGDLILTLEEGGKTQRKWVSRDVLYLNLEQCIKYTALLAFLRAPSALAASQIAELFQGAADQTQDAIDQIMENVRNDGDWMLSRAVTSQRARGLLKWQTQNAAKLPGGQSALAGMAERPRQEHVLDDPTGQWEILRGRIQEAVEKDSSLKTDATTPSYARVAIEAAVKQDKEIQKARLSFWQKFQNTKRKILTPSKMILLGLTLAAAGYAYTPDAAPFEYLTAMGSRIYEYSAGSGIAPQAVNAITSPLKNVSTFLADQYYLQPDGLQRIGSLALSVGFYIGLLPMVYLASFAFHRFYKKESVPFSWWPMSQLVFTDMLQVFAWVNRAFQEGVWKMLRQQNMYPALYAGLDPLNLVDNRKAWNAPWASKETIAQNRESLNQSADRQQQLRLIASRATALAFVAKETGIDPATLNMAGSLEDTSTFLKSLMTDSGTGSQWAVATARFYDLLDKLENSDPGAVSLDPAETDAMVKEYMGNAMRIVNEATRLDQQSYLKQVCESEKLGKAPAETECGQFSVVGFLKDLSRRAVMATSKNVLHWGLFGMPGLKVFNENRGRTVSRNATRTAGMMVGVDYPVSTIALAAEDPGAFLMRQNAPFFGETRIFATQSEQVAAWHAGAQVDAENNAIQSAKSNPYAPLAASFFDPEMGGPNYREQTLDQGLASILLSRTDPNEKSWFGYWQNYLLNVYRFFQAKLLISGTFIGVGLYLKEVAPGEPTSLASLPTLAIFTAAWLWMIKYTFVVKGSDVGYSVAPNYAVLWSVVNMTGNDASAPVGENRQAVMNAVGYLSSHEPAQYQQGIKKLKALFAKHHLPIPERFNLPSTAFNAELKTAFHEWVLQTNSVPGPTKEGTLLNIGLINLGLGALGTTVFYNTLSKDLFHVDADPIVSAAQALGWYSAALVTAVVAGKTAQLTSPVWKPVNWTAEKTIKGVGAARNLVTRSCATLLAGAVGSEPMAYEINLE